MPNSTTVSVSAVRTRRKILLLMLCLLPAWFPRVMAQTAPSEARALTMEEYKKVKTFKIKDLEQDTYVKFEGSYVLDRYVTGDAQMQPPYVFKYSDGLERRIYLYKLLDNRTKKQLGAVALYTTPSDGKTINLCIPNAASDKNVWTAYIDDLKLYGEREKGFLSTTAYVLSREMSALLANGGQPGPSTGAKTDYDVCFPAGTLITRDDGSQTAIEQLRAGDRVSAHHPTRRTTYNEVEEVQQHDGKGYPLSRLLLIPAGELTASTAPAILTVLTLEATPNHPVLTTQGRREVGQLRPGDVLYYHDGTSGGFREMKVRENQSGWRTVQRVYSLKTTSKHYLAGGTVVLDK
ncbi:MAG: hypothetical protein H7Z75_03215 [Ferruginibacter sp.]|nr:hypothetical protein [Cytophagales bacterium]